MSADILKLCDEVLAASKGISGLPWEFGGFCVRSSSNDNTVGMEWGPVRDRKHNRERDGHYIAIAANTAPALAEYIRRLHSAMEERNLFFNGETLREKK